jgi:hypothetical protein
MRTIANFTTIESVWEDAMSTVLFVLLVALVLYNNGVQSYIHFEAYPIFAAVGKDELNNYIAEYEKRLTIPLLAPYGLTLLINILLLFFRVEGVPLIGIIVVLILNLAVALVTLFVATPVYNRVKESGLDEMPRLMNINLLRLIISTASSVVLLYYLYGVITA